MDLPPGTADPLFMHELALEMRMPVGELCDRMSAHELSVAWPLFFEWRRRDAKRQADREKAKPGRR
jgi:hypothetical protein